MSPTSDMTMTGGFNPNIAAIVAIVILIGFVALGIGWGRKRLGYALAALLVLLIPSHMLLMSHDENIAGVRSVIVSIPMLHPCCSAYVQTDAVAVIRPIGQKLLRTIIGASLQKQYRVFVQNYDNKSPPQ